MADEPNTDEAEQEMSNRLAAAQAGVAADPPSPTVGMIVYVAMCLIFALVRYKEPDKQKSVLYTIIFMVAVVIVQWVIGSILIAARCGTADWLGMLFTVAPPWFAVFGSIIAMLEIFPGWVTPFAHTFGYLVNGSSMRRILQEGILDEPPEPAGQAPKEGETGTNAEVIERLKGAVATDPNILLLTLNADEVLNTTGEDHHVGGSKAPNLTLQPGGSLFQRSKALGAFSNKAVADMDPAGRKALADLRRLYGQNDIIGEMVWYLLTGLLASTIAYNAVARSGCDSSTAQIEANEAAYKKRQEDQSAPTA